VVRIPALALICTLGACSGPSYYLQAISGQWKLLHARRDVQSVLDDPATRPELAADLAGAMQIIAFARDQLYLAGNDSYSSFVQVEGDALVWNVVATEEFSLEAKKWCFPVAGCVPYRGYFKQQKARDFAGQLRKRGMDVFVSPAAAYSTLGWFSDPLLSTLFSGSDLQLAAYLFHELAHQRLYIRGDSQFNESYASFVEKTGVESWLTINQRQDELFHWRQLQDASKDFNQLMDKTRNALAKLYQSDKTESVKRKLKASIFDSLVDGITQLSIGKWGGRSYFKGWSAEMLNNARLALYNTYEGGHCGFDALFDEAQGNLDEFHRLAEQKSRLPEEDRKKWLQQPCTGIANEDDP